jgi:hypothetical protein
VDPAADGARDPTGPVVEIRGQAGDLEAGDPLGHGEEFASECAAADDECPRARRAFEIDHIAIPRVCAPFGLETKGRCRGPTHGLRAETAFGERWRLDLARGSR